MDNVTTEELSSNLKILRANLDQFFLVIMGCCIFCEYIMFSLLIHFYFRHKHFFMLILCVLDEKGCEHFENSEFMFGNFIS